MDTDVELQEVEVPGVSIDEAIESHTIIADSAHEVHEHDNTSYSTVDAVVEAAADLHPLLDNAIENITDADGTSYTTVDVPDEIIVELQTMTGSTPAAKDDLTR